MGFRQWSDRAAEVGLDRDAINIRVVRKGDNRAPVIIVDQRLSPGSEQDADARFLPLHPADKSLQFTFVLGEFGAGVRGLGKGTVAPIIVATGQRAAIENVPGYHASS